MIVTRHGFFALHRESFIYYVTCDGYGVSGERVFTDVFEAVAWFERGIETGEF